MEPRIPIAVSTLVVAALGAACASPPEGVRIQKVEGAPGAWAFGEKESLVIVRADDETTTIEFGGRVFVVRGLETFRGALTPGHVLLVGPSLEVYLTREVFRVSEKNRADGAWPLASMPKGARVVYSDGQLLYE